VEFFNNTGWAFRVKSPEDSNVRVAYTNQGTQ
jgi:hypothetical protein